MSEKKLIELGAECVGGDLILSQLTVGRYRDGSFTLTDDGRTYLQKQADDVAALAPALEAAKEEAPAPEKKAASGKKAAKKAAPAPEPEPTPEPETAPSTDPKTADLLSDLDKLTGE